MCTISYNRSYKRNMINQNVEQIVTILQYVHEERGTDKDIWMVKYFYRLYYKKQFYFWEQFIY